MNTPENNPLRGPWTCPDGVVVRDCDGKVVAVMAQGGEPSGAFRCRAVARVPRAYALLEELLAIEGPQPGDVVWASKAATLLSEVRA